MEIASEFTIIRDISHVEDLASLAFNVHVLDQHFLSYYHLLVIAVRENFITNLEISKSDLDLRIISENYQLCRFMVTSATGTVFADTGSTAGATVKREVRAA